MYNIQRWRSKLFFFFLKLSSYRHRLFGLNRFYARRNRWRALHFISSLDEKTLPFSLLILTLLSLYSWSFSQSIASFERISFFFFFFYQFYKRLTIWMIYLFFIYITQVLRVSCKDEYCNVMVV